MRLSPRYTLLILVVCAAIPNLSHAAPCKYKFKIPYGKHAVKKTVPVK